MFDVLVKKPLDRLRRDDACELVGNASGDGVKMELKLRVLAHATSVRSEAPEREPGRPERFSSSHRRDSIQGKGTRESPPLVSAAPSATACGTTTRSATSWTSG